MVKKLILILVAIPLLAMGQEQNSFEKNSSWGTDFETAKKLAKKENKNILVYFSGSDWCAPCKKLQKDFFDAAIFKNHADKYVLLYVDVPIRVDIISALQKEHNNKLVAKYNKSKSFPLVLVLSAKGKVIDKVSGYSYLRDTRYHEALLSKNIKK